MPKIKYHPNLETLENVQAAGFKHFGEYVQARNRFIIHCRKKGTSYADIAKLVGITKQRVYQITRYNIVTGKVDSGATTWGERKRILERDGGKCLICKSDQKLHVHHIKSPLDKSPKNLATLCARCHKKWEGISRVTLYRLAKSYPQMPIDDRQVIC